MQQSLEEEMPFVYVTLATLVTLATAGYTPCLFGYVTIGLARHNRTHFSHSERLLVKPKRPRTDLCAEPVGMWNRLSENSGGPMKTPLIVPVKNSVVSPSMGTLMLKNYIRSCKSFEGPVKLKLGFSMWLLVLRSGKGPKFFPMSDFTKWSMTSVVLQWLQSMCKGLHSQSCRTYTDLFP